MKHTQLNAILSSAIVVAASLLCYPVSSEALPNKHAAIHDSGFAPVFSPKIPAHMTFCSKKVDLDRNDMYERFDRELTSLIYSHGTTMLMLKRANKVFPVVAPILKANGIPADVIYLACAESSLNPRAYSPAKAAGLWQFIASTGKEYGLEINDEIDERYNIEKATKAACRYLKKAYEKYGDWPTVMASYNAGMARISNELDKQISDNSFDLYLNDETSRYVFRIMAIKALLENPGDFGYRLEADQLYRNADYRIVEVSGSVDDWAAWAKEQGISYAQLKEENPWIRSRALTNKTGKTYKVKIPKSDSLYRSKQSGSVYNKAWVN